MRLLNGILNRRGAADKSPTPFRLIAERELAFLVQDGGFDPPEWEPFPHAEEMLIYTRGREEIRIHLGDSANGIDLELLTPDGRLEHMQIDEWLHREGRPWPEETERILASYGPLLRKHVEGLDSEEDDG
jgi:hypothetical protein